MEKGFWKLCETKDKQVIYANLGDPRCPCVIYRVHNSGLAPVLVGGMIHLDPDDDCDISGPKIEIAITKGVQLCPPGSTTIEQTANGTYELLCCCDCCLSAVPSAASQVGWSLKLGGRTATVASPSFKLTFTVDQHGTISGIPDPTLSLEINSVNPNELTSGTVAVSNPPVPPPGTAGPDLNTTWLRILQASFGILLNVRTPQSGVFQSAIDTHVLAQHINSAKQSLGGAFYNVAWPVVAVIAVGVGGQNQRFTIQIEITPI